MNKKELQKENERLKKLVEVLQEEKKALESMIALQTPIYSQFTPWTNCYNDMVVKARIAQYEYNPQSNCCASINYPNGFNPQSNWCKN